MFFECSAYPWFSIGRDLSSDGQAAKLRDLVISIEGLLYFAVEKIALRRGILFLFLFLFIAALGLPSGCPFGCRLGCPK
jgi:hypothetical protein